MDQGRHMVVLLIIHMMLLLWRGFRITKSRKSSLKNNFLHKLKYWVQFNIPTYIVKLLCFISFDNSKLLVYEYSKTIDWIGGGLGTVEHQTSQCSPPIIHGVLQIWNQATSLFLYRLEISWELSFATWTFINLSN